MQPGIVGLRGALIAAWEADLRAVRQDGFDMGRGREALVFMRAPVRVKKTRQE